MQRFEFQEFEEEDEDELAVKMANSLLSEGPAESVALKSSNPGTNPPKSSFSKNSSSKFNAGNSAFFHAGESQQSQSIQAVDSASSLNPFQGPSFNDSMPMTNPTAAEALNLSDNSDDSDEDDEKIEEFSLSHKHSCR